MRASKSCNLNSYFKVISSTFNPFNIEYRWSSHYFYKQGLTSFVKVDFILNTLSPRTAASRMQYLDLVNFNGDDSNPEIDLQAMQLKYNFKDTALESITKGTPTEVPLVQNKRKSLEIIFNSLGLEEELQQLLLSGSRKTSLTNYKIHFIKEALSNKYILKEISAFLNVNNNSFSMLLSRHKISICEV
jgi:putative transposase